MKRGDVVIVADDHGDYSGKPRPGVIVQSDIFNQTHNSISICPMTSILKGDALFRVAVPPSETNKLKRESEVQIDKVQAVRRDRIEETLGRLDETQMQQIDIAMRRWLDL